MCNSLFQRRESHQHTGAVATTTTTKDDAKDKDKQGKRRKPQVRSNQFHDGNRKVIPVFHL